MFPRTTIGGVSVSRLMIGTNWFLGFSHTSQAKDRDIVERMPPPRMAEVIEVFLKAGVDTILGPPRAALKEAIDRAQQRTGKPCISVLTPGLPLKNSPADMDEAKRALDECVQLGATFCLPHQCTTDAFVNMRERSLRGMEPYLAMIRERGMIPGLSTHTPQAPIYADATGLDVETYIQIYNAAGFLMQIEIDWVHRAIWNAKHPVITIKPLAAGKLPPLVGLAFAWSTIRECDSVCIGTSTPYEAEETIELSLALLERRLPHMKLQETRSKQSIAQVNRV